MITVKIYDWKTPFNNVPTKTINKVWAEQWGEDAQIALVYKDGEFTGYAEPLGARTIAKAEEDYTALFQQTEAVQQQEPETVAAGTQAAVSAIVEALQEIGVIDEIQAGQVMEKAVALADAKTLKQAH